MALFFRQKRKMLRENIYWLYYLSVVYFFHPVPNHLKTVSSVAGNWKEPGDGNYLDGIIFKPGTKAAFLLLWTMEMLRIPVVRIR